MGINICNFFGHVILRERVAKSFGWESNGFIPFSIFLFGAAILHIKEMVREKNFNKGNVIIILPDILIPLTIIFYYF
ncbi:MAG TPA: hypothetical protein DC053_13055 [Lachnoclostridium sp.]|nr:hypothetical protein [Lachnoclostridium sp.]